MKKAPDEYLITPERLVEKGLTTGQATSITAQKVLEVVAKDQLVGAEALKSWIDKRGEDLSKLQHSINFSIHELEELFGNLKNAPKLIEDDGTYRFDRCRTNEDKMLLMFRSAIETAKDVFGEDKMSDAVICQIVAAASYAAWRTAPAQWVGEMNGNCKDKGVSKFYR